jgi:hypothetical protein
MATMGVKVLGGGEGPDLNLANTLAKAFFGDPEQEMEFAKARSWMLSQEYDRRQTEAATAYNRARADTAEWELGQRQGAVPVVAGMLEDSTAPSGTSQPVPVEPYVPSIVRPPEPVPVEPTLPDNVETLPTRPGELPPAWLTGQTVPSPFAGAEDTEFASEPVAVEEPFSLPPQLTAVPETAETAALAPAPVPVEAPLTPPVNEGVLDEPATTPVEPEIVADPEDTRPVTSVDVGDGGQPLPLTQAEREALAGMLIANGGDVAGAVRTMMGTTGLTYGDLNDTDRARVNMALATGNPLSATDAVTAADRRDITSEAIRKEVAVEKAKPQKPEVRDVNGVLQEVTGVPGAAVARNVPGAAVKPVDLKAGVITGPDSVPIQLKQGEGGALTGEAVPLTGVPEQDVFGDTNEQVMLKVVEDTTGLVTSGKPVTPENARNYDLVYRKLTQPGEALREGPRGELRRVATPGMDLSGFPTPEDVYRAAGETPPVRPPAEIAAQPAPSTAGPPETAATTVSTSGEGNPADPPVGRREGKLYGTSGVEILVPSEPKDRTEFQNRAMKWMRESAMADAMMKERGAPGWFSEYILNPQQPLSIQNAFARRFMITNEDKQFAALAATFINSEGRINSGASILNPENISFAMRFIPQDGDDAATLALKADQRRVAMDGIYDVFKELATPEQLDELKALGYDRNAPLPSMMPETETAAPPAGVTQEEWDAMPPEDRELFR